MLRKSYKIYTPENWNLKMLPLDKGKQTITFYIQHVSFGGCTVLVTLGIAIRSGLLFFMVLLFF